MKACRKLVQARLAEYRALPTEARDRAARALDIGCQFLLNISDTERGCMTSDDWVTEGLSRCRDLYLPGVVIFMLRTDWPNAQ